MNAYGIDNFTFEIIEECDYEMLEERERYWIFKLNSLEPNGYNIKPGGCKLFGEDNPFYGKHHTEETKRTLSEKNTGRVASDEERRMRRRINSGENNPFYGKSHTQETKAKIKNTSFNAGYYQKASERMKMNNPNDGTYFSKAVMMLNNNCDVIDVFESATSAGTHVKNLNLSKAKYPGNSISEVCRGEQKSAYGFNWQYLNPTLKENLNTKTTGYIISKHRGEGSI